MCIRYDLIRKELDKTYGYENALYWRKLKPSARFIDWLYNHYTTKEFYTLVYDSEPEYDIELFNMYMDYCDKLEGTYVQNKRYSSEYHSNEELLWAYKTILRQRKEYEEKRLTFNNWTDMIGHGLWDMSQQRVDSYSREMLKQVKRNPVSYNGRLYVGQYHDNDLHIFYYGRDWQLYDCYWVMQKKFRK